MFIKFFSVGARITCKEQKPEDLRLNSRPCVQIIHCNYDARTLKFGEKWYLPGSKSFHKSFQKKHKIEEK